MNQNMPAEWSKTERIFFRFAFCYLLFYFIFFSNLISNFFPFFEIINKPLQYVSDAFVGFVNGLLIHKKYDGNIYTGIGDTSWFGIAMFSYFLLSALITIAWTIFDKRKNYFRLFSFLHAYARYYLAFVLFGYGFGKLFGVQFFDPIPNNLMQPLGNIDPHALLWVFMGASKSYNYFGGLMEVIPALLLLLKRTTLLGVLIAIPVLVNVIILDIGYDTLVKAISLHCILIGLFILSPYIKRVFNFFLLQRSASLPNIPVPYVHKRFIGVQKVLGFLLIAILIFAPVYLSFTLRENYLKPYLGGIDGVYEIKEFYKNQQILPPLSTDSARWKKIGINKFGEIAVAYMNDSVAYYSINADTTTKVLTLNSWNDSTFKSKLNYSLDNSGNYVFEGIYKKDSIRFISTKANLQNYPLLKDKGKVKWVWW